MAQTYFFNLILILIIWLKVSMLFFFHSQSMDTCVFYTLLWECIVGTETPMVDQRILKFLIAKPTFHQSSLLQVSIWHLDLLWFCLMTTKSLTLLDMFHPHTVSSMHSMALTSVLREVPFFIQSWTPRISPISLILTTFTPGKFRITCHGRRIHFFLWNSLHIFLYKRNEYWVSWQLCCHKFLKYNSSADGVSSYLKDEINE